MRLRLISTGMMRVVILTTALLWANAVLAETSSSFVLTNDYPNAATTNTLTSTSFSVEEGQMTWNEKPMTSGSFQLVLPGGSAVSSSSSTSSSAATSQATSASSSVSSTPRSGGGRRPATGTPSAPGALSSSRLSVPTKPAAGGASSASTSAASSAGTLSSSTSSDAFQDVDPLILPDVIVAPANLRPGLNYVLRTLRNCETGELLHFFDATSVVPCLHDAADPFPYAALIVWILLITALGSIGYASRLAAQRESRVIIRKLLKFIAYISHLTSLLLLTAIVTTVVHAAATAPNTHIYNGRLLNSSGQPITTAHSIRFSYWSSVDYVSTDTTVAGAINTASTTYAGWNEVHTVTPNAQGYFSVTIGSVNTLPDFSTLSPQTLLSLYLQVEVKASAAADTAYELLDSDSTDTSIDRSGILSVPFAQNADMIDRREIGTGSGNIAILGSGSTLPTSTIPGSTNANAFLLDADNTATTEIALTFGANLAKKLSYDVSAGTFRFNDDVEIQGNLTVSGLVNGVQISQLQSATGALKAFSGGGLNLNVSHGSYRLNGTATNYAGGILALPANATRSVFFGSGGLQHSAAFPSDESYIPVAEVTTSAGSIVSIADRRTLQNDDREHERLITFHPAYEKASYQGDGADNVGQLSVSHDNIALRNFYVWTSTKTALQDYDVLIRVPVPADFVRWQTAGTRNPISLQYRSTSGLSADNKLDIQIYDTAGVPVSLSGSVSNLTGTSWSTTEVEFSGSPTWTAGQEMLIRLKLSAKDNYQMHIGSLRLQLVELE